MAWYRKLTYETSMTFQSNIMEDETSIVGSSSSIQDEEFKPSSGSSTGTVCLGDSSPTENTPLAHKETKYLAWSKVLVLVVLAVATIGCAIVAYIYTKGIEDMNFSARYHDFANEILVVSQVNAIHIFQTYESMSLQMTAFAKGTKSKWPLVQFPHFEAQAQQAMDQTGAEFLSFTPLVSKQDRQAYEEYANTNQEWIQESIIFSPNSLSNISVPSSITMFDESTGKRQEAQVSELYAPIAQTSPLTETHLRFLNYDVFDYPFFKRVFDGMIAADRAILSEVLAFEYLPSEESVYGENGPGPASFMASPIYDKLGQGRTVVGVISAEIPWDSYFQNLIPEGIDGIYLVVRNTCNQAHTYVIHGPKVTYVGPGDTHDSSYDGHEISSDFTAFTSIKECRFSLHLFPSDELVEVYQSNQPLINAAGVVFIFIITTCVFMMYDCLVERRQFKVMTSATRTNAIVESLFPENVRNRLLIEVGADQDVETQESSNGRNFFNPNNSLKALKEVNRRNSSSNGNSGEIATSDPIADLFPNATVLFGDISGFTAWSSVRDPTQVFILLETVYGAFDKIARKLGVFKVETIGDSYVAATGLPEARHDHTVVMARFARLCLNKLNEVVDQLDTRLGPGTADLAMRFGIHSGPVTAGVLRGEKSRFQLFGDTVNTASRMESTGAKGKVQVSQEAAESLIACGKAQWITPRETKIVAKGKGELQTYWLTLQPLGNLRSSASDSLRDSTEQISCELHSFQHKPEPTTSSSQRLIEWNVDNLACELKKVVEMRFDKDDGRHRDVSLIEKLNIEKSPGRTVLDEVSEFISLPDVAAKYKENPIRVNLSDAVYEQLRHYVTKVASAYGDHPFHSFSHATHVGQSVSKLLSRVVTPDTTNRESVCEESLHRNTFGIASDPLTQFACAFSALIHDVDHPGVPNSQLIEERTETAIQYNFKSVAEQNSVDVAWELLMESRYSDLRACIYTNQAELDRFRQLVVNAVMATDIVDKKLFVMRRTRWEKAFDWQGYDDDDTTLDIEREVSNRKATVVIELLMQASDVSHTMQHWHVYTEWNKKLFQELYKAYSSGRAATDPSLSWYQGELGFFDYYIIPLAKKLKECGVFGVASDEYLNYAEANRREWEIKGEELVRSYLEKYRCLEDGVSTTTNLKIT